jgi:hypothetical protein
MTMILRVRDTDFEKNGAESGAAIIRRPAGMLVIAV